MGSSNTNTTTNISVTLPLKVLDLYKRQHLLEINPNRSIADLKAEITRITGTSPQKYMLKYKDMIVDETKDTDMIGDIGVREFDQVYMEPRDISPITLSVRDSGGILLKIPINPLTTVKSLTQRILQHSQKSSEIGLTYKGKILTEQEQVLEEIGMKDGDLLCVFSQVPLSSKR
ncbi:unnamed protein product [Moneuplotes crassus]|uniref:Ubiquitin-like domain-containing protein n=1 Tax=Euplotes crassus TaxID=5936 RepID=A0AAD1Y082_EUPCR|nr:unnamed protein product [Moneuplotes crassus]